MSDAAHDWVDVTVSATTPWTIRYRTGLLVYEEVLAGGQYVGSSWNAAGYSSAWEDARLAPATHPTPQAFWIEIDGQFLGSHWEVVDVHQTDEPTGKLASVILRHGLRPITVCVHTLLDGTAVLTRWLDITNTGERSAALAAAYPWSGVLLGTRNWAAHTEGNATPLYELGTMADDRWGNEGFFQWQPLPAGTLRIDGRYRRNRFRHPMFVLRNNATGEHFFAQLGWSGGYAMEFDLDLPLSGPDGRAKLAFRIGPDAPAPQRVIAPGETITTPKVHLGLLLGDLDATVHAMHDHVRRSVLMPQARGRGGWVESGIGPEVEITPEAVMAQIDVAAQLGAEVFFIDASWYAAPNSFWHSTVGDWEVSYERFPDGLGPIRARARQHGILFGLWMDAERIAPKSRVVAEHPEWLAVPYSGERKLGDMLDLTNPDAASWMEDQIARLLSEQELDFFRLDYNVGPIGPGAWSIRDGYIESSYWRYYETLYGIYERLRARFPHVIFETCASGGGRTDLAMVRNFSHTWVTDWPIAPRAFSITNGMTMALPPEHVDRLLGGQNGHLTADLDFQARLLLFARPTVALFHPPGVAPNPVQVARIRHTVDIYKDFVRRFNSQGRIYHHTPTFQHVEPHGWGVLELAATDRSRAIGGIFQLSVPQESVYWFRPRGLDRGRRYRVTWDTSGQSAEIDGLTLMQHGLPIRLEGALTSELLLFEAV